MGATVNKPLSQPETRVRGVISLVLRCDNCGKTRSFSPWFRLTKMGVLRLEGGSHGFYVDGGNVLCSECVGAEAKAPAQKETWGQYDRRNVEADQEERAFLEGIVQQHPRLEISMTSRGRRLRR